ncbi:MAG TPA: hypothetical protein VGQ19_13910 [Burkholderiales bacterium]|jgi:hypothetical protein|nr:hypothetical protein [Burkholderiales bacterium]
MQTDTSGYMRANVERDPRHFASFVAHQVINEIKSKEAGRPIIESKPYLRLERAGERDVLMREVNEDDKRAYPEAWRAYEEKREQRPVGTPLSVLFPVHPEIVATLEYFKVYTVEQLARISDTNMQTIGLGGREWYNKAVEYLKASEGAQGFHTLKKEIEAAQATITKQAAQIAAMEGALAARQQPGQIAAAAPPSDELRLMREQMAALMAKVDRVADPTPAPRRGRPRKPQPSTEEAA